MKNIEDVLKEMKELYETTIRTATFQGAQKTDGLEAKKCLIRSSRFINHLHEHIKETLIQRGVPEKNMAPKLGTTSGEFTMCGFYKRKRQDICVKPIGLMPKRELIKEGHLANTYDRYGTEFSERILTINVRSQLSSTRKNYDTLMERTQAESNSLHTRLPNLVMGEVYLILAQEYDEQAMKENKVVFKDKIELNEKQQGYIQGFIKDFYNYNNRTNRGAEGFSQYERCALLIVDMNRETPKLYRKTEELKQDGLISEHFEYTIEPLAYDTFVDDLLKIYDSRFGLKFLLEEQPNE